MDLRIIKTKKNIREAFLELRKKHSVDEIKVNELCKQAMINKTTFYNHYQDVYELSEELEQEVLQNFYANFKDMDMLLTDPERFIRGMNEALACDDNMLRILYRDHFDELVRRIEIHIKSLYAKEHQMLISFLIGGSVHLMLKPGNENAKVEEFLSRIVQKIMG